MGSGQVAHIDDVPLGAPLPYPYASECAECDQPVVIDQGWVNNNDGGRHACR